MTTETKTRVSRVTDENVQDIVDTAAYGGITYWAVQPTQAEFDAAPDDTFTIVDGDPDGDGDERTVYYLTKDQIRAAFHKVRSGKAGISDNVVKLFKEAYAEWDEQWGIDCVNIDADGADVIVQVAAFGKLVYG